MKEGKSGSGEAAAWRRAWGRRSGSGPGDSASALRNKWGGKLNVWERGVPEAGRCMQQCVPYPHAAPLMWIEVGLRVPLLAELVLHRTGGGEGVPCARVDSLLRTGGPRERRGAVALPGSDRLRVRVERVRVRQLPVCGASKRPNSGDFRHWLGPRSSRGTCWR